MREAFRRERIATHALDVSRAFHSRLIDPILDELERIAARARFEPPHIPVISNLSGCPAGPEIQTAAYWRRHAREPVRFQGGIEWLKAERRRGLPGDRSDCNALFAGPVVHSGGSGGMAAFAPRRERRVVLTCSMRSAASTSAEHQWTGGRSTRRSPPPDFVADLSVRAKPPLGRIRPETVKPATRSRAAGAAAQRRTRSGAVGSQVSVGYTGGPLCGELARDLGRAASWQDHSN